MSENRKEDILRIVNEKGSGNTGKVELDGEIPLEKVLDLFDGELGVA